MMSTYCHTCGINNGRVWTERDGRVVYAHCKVCKFRGETDITFPEGWSLERAKIAWANGGIDTDHPVVMMHGGRS